MRRNSNLSFPKGKSFILVLTLMLVSAGTMALLFTAGDTNLSQNSQIAQKEARVTETPAEPSGEPKAESKVSDIALLEGTLDEALLQNTPVTEQAELEDQFVEAPEVADASALQEASADQAIAENFDEAGALQLQWPVQGEVLMEFAMDHSVYFKTLAQYQYNPALIISAAEGSEVVCGADGTVIASAYSNEIGNYVTMDLGDGFMLTYGQLEGVNAEVGEHLNAGEKLGIIAKPSRSYTEEGANLYLKLTKDDAAVNPAEYLNGE